MPHHWRAQAKEIFNNIDGSADGYVQKAELRQALCLSMSQKHDPWAPACGEYNHGPKQEAGRQQHAAEALSSLPRWGLKRSGDGNTETEMAFMGFVDREFAKADRNLDAKLDFEEFKSLFATVAASMKT